MIKNLFFLKSTWGFLQNFSPSCQRVLLLGRLLVLICLGNSLNSTPIFFWGERVQFLCRHSGTRWTVLPYISGASRCGCQAGQGAVPWEPGAYLLPGQCWLPLHSQKEQLRGPSQSVHSTTWHIFIIMDPESLSELTALVLQMHSKHWGLMLSFN